MNGKFWIGCGAVLLAFAVAGACRPAADSGGATPSLTAEDRARASGASVGEWLREVDTSTMPGLLAVLDEDAIERVTAILQDQRDPTWREKLKNGEWTDPEGLALWRGVARADVTRPLSDVEAAYLEYARGNIASFAEWFSRDGSPAERRLGFITDC